MGNTTEPQSGQTPEQWAQEVNSWMRQSNRAPRSAQQAAQDQRRMIAFHAIQSELEEDVQEICAADAQDSEDEENAYAYAYAYADEDEGLTAKQLREKKREKKRQENRKALKKKLLQKETVAEMTCVLQDTLGWDIWTRTSEELLTQLTWLMLDEEGVQDGNLRAEVLQQVLQIGNWYEEYYLADWLGSIVRANPTGQGRAALEAFAGWEGPTQEAFAGFGQTTPGVLFNPDDPWDRNMGRYVMDYM